MLNSMISMIQLLVGETEVCTTYKEYMPPLYHQNTNDLATSNRVVFIYALYFFSSLFFSSIWTPLRSEKGSERLSELKNWRAFGTERGSKGLSDPKGAQKGSRIRKHDYDSINLRK